MLPAYYEDLKEIKKKIWSMLNDAVINRSSQFRIPVFVCGDQEDFDKAKSIFEEVRSKSSGLNYEMAAVNLAYTYEAMGNLKKAIGLYKLAINSNSNFPLFQVYWSLARCHENNNDILDKNFFGIPKEPYGFSGGTSSGVPSFYEASTSLASDTINLTIQLR